MVDDDSAPIDPRAMRRVGGSLGSNPAAVMEDAQGRRYYVKTLDSPAHARNEWLAACLYALAGAPTLHYVRTAAPNQVATVWQPLVKTRVAQLSAEERRQAQHWLGVHAWTANWDAAGFDGDNQGVADGTVLTLDVGGALLFRAQGDPKGRAFGDRCDEIDLLRTDPDNPHACRLFGGMDEAALPDAVAVVTRIAEADIRATVLRQGGSVALADRLVARKADLARRAARPSAARADGQALRGAADQAGFVEEL